MKYILLTLILGIISFQQGYTQKVYYSNGLYGLHDINGNILKPEYHYIWPENGGMRKVVKLYRLLDKIIPQYGYINNEGKEIVPCKFLYATDYINGFAIVGDKIRTSKYEHTRMDYWYTDAKGNISRSSFDFALTPDSHDIAIVGKLYGTYMEYCHPEYFSMHYRYLHSDELMDIKLSDHHQFPYTYVSKFVNGIAKVSKSFWNDLKLDESYIDESFNACDQEKEIDIKFLNNWWSWSDWVFKKVELGPFNIIQTAMDIKIYNKITGELVDPIILEYHESPEPLNPDHITEQFNKGMMGIKDLNHSITCAFDLLDLTYAHKGFIQTYSYDTKKHGLLDLRGKVIIAADEYNTLSPCSEDYIIYTKGDESGILDKKGIDLLNTTDYVFHGQIKQKKWFVFSYKGSNLQGIISLDGNVLLYPKYERIGSNMYSLLAVRRNGKWGFINNDFQLQIPCKYDEILHAFTVYGVALVKKDNIEEVINLNGDIECDELLRKRIFADQRNIINRNRRL